MRRRKSSHRVMAQAGSENKEPEVAKIVLLVAPQAAEDGLSETRVHELVNFLDRLYTTHLNLRIQLLQTYVTDDERNYPATSGGLARFSYWVRRERYRGNISKDAAAVQLLRGFNGCAGITAKTLVGGMCTHTGTSIVYVSGAGELCPRYNFLVAHEFGHICGMAELSETLRDSGEDLAAGFTEYIMDPGGLENWQEKFHDFSKDLYELQKVRFACLRGGRFQGFSTVKNPFRAISR